MITSTSVGAGVARRRKIFQGFKYGIYCLLALNILFFLSEEWLAAGYVFGNNVAPGELISAFSATIDTAAWVVLLLLFELETYQIPRHGLRGRLKWTLHGVRAFCYLFILYAFYGYAMQCLALYRVVPVALADPCTLAGDTSFMVTLDEFVGVTAANCDSLPVTSDMYRLAGGEGAPVTDAHGLHAARRLAWTDVINAGVWLLVVLLLELDLRLKERGNLRGTVRSLLGAFTGLLYATLLGCAVYWGIFGKFLDFWDAFLWLVAFVFIEMNVFRWQESAAPT